MLFNSFSYIVMFLPIVSIIHIILLSKKLVKQQKIWIIISSLFFYSLSSFKHLPLFLFSIILNYLLSIYIKRSNKKKIFLSIGIIFNVILLLYFKYTNFIIGNVNFLFSLHIPFIKITLPLAISYYTFQQISYLVNTYYGTIKNSTFMNYLFFVSFFPQLIAGPITTYNTIISQIEDEKNHTVNNENIFRGELLFFIGLFKKIVISDYFLTFANLGFDKISNLTMIGGWFTSLSYAIQLYFDFSSLSDMALGSALIFNINLPINFNSPFKSLNVLEFWADRWHITLSHFLKNYIYFPLGGSKKGEFRTYINVMIIFIISGLWHGSSWNFVIWGLLNGIGNALCRFWKKKVNIKINNFLSWFLTFLYFDLTLIIFRTTNFNTIKKIFCSMFNIKSLLVLPEFKAKYYLNGFDAHTKDILILILIIISTIILPNSTEISQKIKIKTKFQSYIYSFIFAIIAILLIAKLVMKPYTEFIYSTF